MLPVKITNYLNNLPAPQSGLGPGRVRPPSQQPPKLLGVQSVVPDEERRVASRRTLERRERDQASFLDTRTPHGRRRTPGRRAGDQLAPEVRRSISIKA